MNTTTIGASHIPGLFETMPIRQRADLPALRGIPAIASRHDFLVPNLRPDLTDEAAREDIAQTDDAPKETQARPGERHRFIEPDSIFWSPESQAGDAA